MTTHISSHSIRIMAVTTLALGAVPRPSEVQGAGHGGKSLDGRLYALLEQHGFTGRIEVSLPDRLGRNVDVQLADLGRNLFFDPILALRGDNSCVM